MTSGELAQRLREVCAETLPVPGCGSTAARHARLMQVGREDLTLAKLAEAHWDATAILLEAGRQPRPGALYAVWASESAQHAIQISGPSTELVLSGTKMFASGAGMVDRALITVAGTRALLFDISMREQGEAIQIDGSPWQVDAFRLTQTSTVTVTNLKVEPADQVGEPGWYTDRVGFWHGALGPAACWAGGVAGLLDYALQSKRRDPHTLAHLGAMRANVWALAAYLETAANEMDALPDDREAAQRRALMVRHLVEQACTDTLERFGRAYGPYPLTMEAAVARRYQEATIYIRQSHAERDLEALGQMLAVAE